MEIKRGDQAKRHAPTLLTRLHRAPYVLLSLILCSVLSRLLSQFINLLSPPSRLLPARSSASLAAQLSLLLLLLLSSSSSIISAARSSCRASDSASPPTPAVGDQPLSCQTMLRVALPPSSRSIQSALFPSTTPPPFLKHIHAFDFLFFFNF